MSTTTMSFYRPSPRLRLPLLLLALVAMALFLRETAVDTRLSSGRSIETNAPPVQSHGKKTDEELEAEVEEAFPRIPVRFLLENARENRRLVSRDGEILREDGKRMKTFCARLPQLYNIHVNNRHWQELRAGKNQFYLYGAYLDLRQPNHPSVRILLVTDHPHIATELYCQLWFNDTESLRRGPDIIKVPLERNGENNKKNAENDKPIYLWYTYWGSQEVGAPHSYILTCPLPRFKENKKVPIAVSLVENECDCSTNILSVTYEPLEEGQQKQEIAVCVKGVSLYNADSRVLFKLVEWIELMGILGATKIFTFDLNMSEELRQLFKFYEKTGKVNVTPFSLSAFRPNFPALQNLFIKNMKWHAFKEEIITYNDCLYRNLYRFKYLVVVDLDEVIVPRLDKDWHGLLNRLEEYEKVGDSPRSHYAFRNVYFLDDMEESKDKHQMTTSDLVPEHLHILRHTLRSANYSKKNEHVKSIVCPDQVTALHNHLPFSCLRGSCHGLYVPTGLGHMAHYRSTCAGADEKKCQQFKTNLVEDKKILEDHGPELVQRTNTALRELGLIHLIK